MVAKAQRIILGTKDHTQKIWTSKQQQQQNKYFEQVEILKVFCS